jgi:hypothetical protein
MGPSTITTEASKTIACSGSSLTETVSKCVPLAAGNGQASVPDPEDEAFELAFEATFDPEAPCPVAPDPPPPSSGSSTTSESQAPKQTRRESATDGSERRRTMAASLASARPSVTPADD